jgi:ribose transport system permease protein
VKPAAVVEPQAPEPTRGSQPDAISVRLLRGLAFSRIGAVYVWLVICIVFAIWAPQTFPTTATIKQVLNTNAITALAALSITIPLACRVFDLSFAATMTLTGVVTAHFLVDGTPLVLAIAIGLLVGVAVGVLNAFVVVVMRIDSFIGTLATGSLISALVTMVSHDNSIIGVRLTGSFAAIGQNSIGGFQYPVFYAAVVAVVLWYLLEHTATGRRIYATGFNSEGARLAGVKTRRLKFVSLVVSGTLAGATGIVLASQTATGSPTAGTPYLLPAFAASFLGATQLKHGRFNSFGTLIAVLLLGTGTTGLALVNAPTWAADMFVGVVLIASLALTGVQQRGTGAGLLDRLRSISQARKERVAVPG